MWRYFFFDKTFDIALPITFAVSKTNATACFFTGFLKPGEKFENPGWAESHP